MKSVLFFIESLDIGGAEVVFNNIISNIDKNKFDITVVSEKDNGYHTQNVKSNCKYKSFIKTKYSKTYIGKIINSLIIKLSLVLPPKLVKNLFMRGKYDIEIAFCEGYATKIIGSGKSRSKRIAWIHCDLLNYPWSEKTFGSSENEKECYKNFDKVVCVSNTIKDSFIKKFGMEEKTHVLYNTVDSETIIKKGQEECVLPQTDGISFVLVGNYKKIKGYDRLIEVCHQLKKQGYIFTVSVFGGGEHIDLDTLIKKYELNDTVFLFGRQENPYKYISRADALICSSYAEGYSTTVCESVVLGTPVITTECSGMREIFGDSECGIICENSEEGLREAIKTVLDNPEKLEVFSRNALERAKDFSIEKRITELESFLENI